MEMYDAIEREQPGAVIHCGDCYEDAVELRRAYPNLTVYAVLGNNDWGDAPREATIRCAGVPIYFTHGHREWVSARSPGSVPVHAESAGCRFALFGHTHRVYMEQHGPVLVINPGSISLPRSGPATYCRLTLEDGGILDAEIVDTEGEPFVPVTL
ncbi:MAG: metallophosphoesterase family protein [Butyricicoccus sp.]|nr:metallophosphoesterase family protein [Butyricicoccus sp.]